MDRKSLSKKKKGNKPHAFNIVDILMCRCQNAFRRRKRQYLTICWRVNETFMCGCRNAGYFIRLYVVEIINIRCIFSTVKCKVPCFQLRLLLPNMCRLTLCQANTSSLLWAISAVFKVLVFLLFFFFYFFLNAPEAFGGHSVGQVEVYLNCAHLAVAHGVYLILIYATRSFAFFQSAALFRLAGPTNGAIRTWTTTRMSVSKGNRVYLLKLVNQRHDEWVTHCQVFCIPERSKSARTYHPSVCTLSARASLNYSKLLCMQIEHE